MGPSLKNSATLNSILAGALVFSAGAKAQAHSDFRDFRQQNPDIARHQARLQFRNQVREASFVPSVSPFINYANSVKAPSVNLPTSASGRHSNLDFDLSSSARHANLGPSSPARRTNLNLGLSSSEPHADLNLDLSSSERNILLPNDLFKNGRSITIETGGEKRTLSAGDSVTAAEFVAITQERGGRQAIDLDASGRAVGGSFSFKTLTGDTDLRIGDVTIPTNVSASDKINARTQIQISGDLNNYGSITETLLGRRSVAQFVADDIHNHSGASIIAAGNRERTSGLELLAEGVLVNEGTISSSGSINVVASRGISNVGSGSSIVANADVSLNSSAFENSGTIDSDNGNVLISAATSGAVSEVSFNNVKGVVNATNGNIVFGTSVGSNSVNVGGGDLLSRNLLLKAGTGTINVDVEKLTGRVISDGAAVHVKASTDTLVIGDQNLCGDPTYYNDAGDIVISGNIAVGEALAIIASGNITATNAVSTITTSGAQGYDINIIAGANVSGLATDDTATIPGMAATGDVSLTGSSSTGGDVDFSAANANLLISSNSTSSNNAGGNITIAAFNGTTGGNVLLPSESNIDASGNGIGAFGDVSVIATKFIVIGSVSHAGAAGAADIDLRLAQPVVSDGNAIVFAVNGSISSGNYLTGGSLSGFGTSIEAGDLRSLGGTISVVASSVILGNLDATGGSTSDAGTVDVLLGGFAPAPLSIGSATSNSILSINVSGGSVSGNAGTINVFNSGQVTGSIIVGSGGLVYDVVDGDGASISLRSGLNISLPSGVFDVSGAGSDGDGGSIQLIPRHDLSWADSATSPLTLRANGSGTGDGGSVDYRTSEVFPSVWGDIVLGFDPGQINAEAKSGSNGGNGGSVKLANLASIAVNGAALDVSPRGVNGNGGSIELGAALLTTPNASHVVLTANGVGIGNGGSITLRAPVSGLTIGLGASQFELFAESGTSSGDGGTIFANIGFNFTAFTNAIHANPMGTTGDGADISLISGMTNSYRIVGDLIADGVGSGNGGSVLLSSGAVGIALIEQFDIGKSDTQNGITGTVSVKGATNGSVFIESNGPLTQYVDLINAGTITYRSGGDISINKQLGDASTDSITLRSFSAGDLTSSGVLRANTVNLQTVSGAIGGKKPFAVSATNLSLIGGTVNVQNSSGIDVNLGVSQAQTGAFKLTSNGIINTTGAISGATSVTLSSNGKLHSDIVIGDSISTNLVDGVVSLSSSRGSIFNSNAGTNSIQAFQVNLDAKHGQAGIIGTPLRLIATNIDANTPDLRVTSFNPSETHLGNIKTRILELTSNGDILIDTTLKADLRINLATVANNGDIVLNSSLGMTKTMSIVLDAVGSGNISQSSTKIRVTASAIELYSDSGNIGSALVPLSLNSSTLKVNDVLSPGGQVNILELSKNVVLVDSTATQSFNLSTAGSLQVNDLSASAITLVAGGGLLQVADGATLETTAGGISINNAGKSKSTKIEIGAGASVLSMDAPGGGEIDIFIGTLPTTPILGTAPANVTVTTPAAVFFNGGIIALAPNNTLSAINTSLVFSTGKLSASAIELGGGVTIVADPPASAPAVYSGNAPSGGLIEMIWSAAR